MVATNVGHCHPEFGSENGPHVSLRYKVCMRSPKLTPYTGPETDSLFGEDGLHSLIQNMQNLAPKQFSESAPGFGNNIDM